MPILEASVKGRLGADTKFADKVNDVAGFWVSFKIDGDEYWLRLDRERLERVSNAQWLGWATVTLALALLGAVVISRLINQPLARLTAATRLIANGQRPRPLPEKGPAEIRDANRSFNQMVADLERVESDRAVILAGISHDLRTPLARMQLEVEMAQLDDAARSGIQSDLAQMDAIIAQFLEYARPDEGVEREAVDLAGLLSESAGEAERLPDVRVKTEISDRVKVLGNPTDLKRLVGNLVENARRYGKTPLTETAEIELRCRADGHEAIVEIADNGPGVPEDDLERLSRPFTRLDAARSQANGAGLGLAIVERIVKRHHGSLRLANRSTGGLRITISLPLAGGRA